MYRLILVVTCAFLCQVLFSRQEAIAIESKYLVSQMYERGVLGYYRHTFENSQALKYVYSQIEQDKMLESVANKARGKVKDIRAATIYSIPGIELNVAEVVGEDATSLLFLMSSSDHNDSVYMISLIRLGEDTIFNILDKVIAVLESSQMSSSVIDATRNALQKTLHSRDATFIDDYERLLVSKATSVPQYITKRLSEGTEENRSRFKYYLELLGVNGELKYLGSKSVIGQHHIALFGAASAWGPLVFGVHFQVLETGPIVMDTAIFAGMNCTPYLTDYVKVFSAVKKSPEGTEHK